MIRILESSSQEAKEFLERLRHRGQLQDENVLRTVNRILEDVRKNGDKAVIKYTRKLDAPRISVKELRVSERELNKAYSLVDSEFLDAIKHARTNIERFIRNSCGIRG